MRTIIQKRTRYIERTRDFYVQEGFETKPNFIEAIKKREAMGDKLTEADILSTKIMRL